LARSQGATHAFTRRAAAIAIAIAIGHAAGIGLAALFTLGMPFDPMTMFVMAGIALVATGLVHLAGASSWRARCRTGRTGLDAGRARDPGRRRRVHTAAMLAVAGAVSVCACAASNAASGIPRVSSCCGRLRRIPCRSCRHPRASRTSLTRLRQLRATRHHASITMHRAP
jgi:hypothetical protein